MSYKGYILFVGLLLYGSLIQAQQVLDTICVNANSSTHLAVPYNPDLNYQWIINGGLVIGRSDTNDVLIQWGSIPGLYLSSVVTEDNRGCFGDTMSVYMFLKGSNSARAKGPAIVCKGETVTMETVLPNSFVWSGGSTQSTLSFIADRDTTIMLVALNGLCGNDTSYFNVQTVDMPLGSMSFVPDTMKLDDLVNVYYSGAPIDFIDWYVNGQLVSQRTNTLVNFDREGTYEIIQVTRNGANCADTIRKTVYVVGEFKVFIPNTFTPNNDGINDLFTFKGVGIQSFEAQIYNRWGEMVYEWNEKSLVQGWDGRNSGKDSKMDAYVYKITVTDYRGRPHYFYDSFNLIR